MDERKKNIHVNLIIKADKDRTFSAQLASALSAAAFRRILSLRRTDIGSERVLTYGRNN